MCYLINKKLAYASDISLFYKKDYKKLTNLDYLNYRLSLVQKSFCTF